MERCDKSKPAIFHIERLIKEYSAVGYDESGCYVNGNLNGSWIAQSTYTTFVFLVGVRGARVLEECFGYSLKNMVADRPPQCVLHHRLPKQSDMSGASAVEF